MTEAQRMRSFDDGDEPRSPQGGKDHDRYQDPLPFIHGLWLLIEACPVGEGSGLAGDEN
jgi:hypothetical protein